MKIRRGRLKIIKRIIKNIHLKLLSVTIACTIWFMITSQEVSRQKFEVPLEYLNMPEELIISGEQQETIDVWIKGTARLLKKITPGYNLIATVDLGNVIRGIRDLRITEDEIPLPFSRLSIFKISPSVITVNIEMVKRKMVDVFPDFEGSVRDGYKLEWNISPARIEIEGPESVVDRTFTAITDPILLEDRQGTITKRVNIRINPQLINLTAAEADINIRIAEEEIEADLEGVILQVVPGRYQYRLDPESISVTVEGPRSKILSLTPGAIRAELFLEDLLPAEDFYELSPKIELPDKIKHKSSLPDVIRVKILNDELEPKNSRAISTTRSKHPKMPA